MEDEAGEVLHLYWFSFACGTQTFGEKVQHWKDKHHMELSPLTEIAGLMLQRSWLSLLS
jgi:hypothetical protein